MDTSKPWSESYHHEIVQAEAARTGGNEGKARVCARRAAGIVAGAYLQSKGIDFPTPSAYDRLRYLKSQPGLSVEVNAAVEHLLVRITPEYTLPVDADLIADARFLCQELLGEQ
jgi:hypothetical protein